MTIDISPRADYGLFGPDSVAWRVFAYPTSVVIGFQRTAVTEMFDAPVFASVDATQSLYRRPELRYERTLHYTATLIFGDSTAVVKSADTLMRIHAHMHGEHNGVSYDALDPDGQLWIHMTEWHSVLYVYERFGPGRLSKAEEEEYWAACAEAAKCQTIDPASVPRSRAEVRAYFERVRPDLATSDAVRDTVAHFLDARFLTREMPRAVRALSPVLLRVERLATISTLPGWMRELAGIRQGPVTDAAVRPIARTAYALLNRMPHVQIAYLRSTAPAVVPILGPVILGLTPDNPATVTPEDAWAATGGLMPRQRWEQSMVDPASEDMPAFAG